MDQPAVLDLTSPDPPRPPREKLTAIRIVIADDDPEALDLLSDIMRGPATEIRRATSGAELAVLLADHGPFDLIVTDIDMPWMEGLAVIRSARASEIRAPVLVVSGLSRPDLAAQVERLGNARFLRKPIEVSALRAAVKDLMTNAS